VSAPDVAPVARTALSAGPVSPPAASSARSVARGSGTSPSSASCSSPRLSSVVSDHVVRTATASWGDLPGGGWAPHGAEPGHEADEHVVTRGREPWAQSDQPCGCGVDACLPAAAQRCQQHVEGLAGAGPTPAARLGGQGHERSGVGVTAGRNGWPPGPRHAGVDHAPSHGEAPATPGDAVTGVHGQPPQRREGRQGHAARSAEPLARQHGPDAPADDQVDGPVMPAHDVAQARSRVADSVSRGVGVHEHRAAGHSRALMKSSDDDTQPKIPPCALIISRPTRWNSGKYEATPSEITAHS
jgi:hypothetical protein